MTRAGVFSGSAIETDEGHALIYTSVREEEVKGVKVVRQTQSLALGDGILIKRLSKIQLFQGTSYPMDSTKLISEIQNVGLRMVDIG